MNYLRPTLAVISALILTVVASGQQEEVAKIPYQKLAGMAKAKKIEGKVMKFRIKSDQGVALKDIKLILMAKAGETPILIDAKGELSIPLTDLLLKENPTVVSNQPQGSLNLSLILPAPAAP